MASRHTIANRATSTLNDHRKFVIKKFSLYESASEIGVIGAAKRATHNFDFTGFSFISRRLLKELFQIIDKKKEKDLKRSEIEIES